MAAVQKWRWSLGLIMKEPAVGFIAAIYNVLLISLRASFDLSYQWS